MLLNAVDLGVAQVYIKQVIKQLLSWLFLLLCLALSGGLALFLIYNGVDDLQDLFFEVAGDPTSLERCVIKSVL